MSKCTGKRCPMQVGYDVENCQCEGCSYRTAPMTNYDRIRNMSVEESADKLFGGKTFCPHRTYWNMNRCAKRSCTECIKEWLESEVTEE